jgi:hypothetical protein
MNVHPFFLNPRLSAFISGPNYFTASKAGDSEPHGALLTDHGLAKVDPVWKAVRRLWKAVRRRWTDVVGMGPQTATQTGSWLIC